MSSDPSHISEKLHTLEQEVVSVLSRYPADGRKQHLQDLLLLLARAAEVHYHLMKADGAGRLRVAEGDYHEILEVYLPILREFTSLPRSFPGSVYELGVISCFDEVLIHHCEGQR